MLLKDQQLCAIILIDCVQKESKNISQKCRKLVSRGKKKKRCTNKTQSNNFIRAKLFDSTGAKINCKQLKHFAKRLCIEE